MSNGINNNNQNGRWSHINYGSFHMINGRVIDTVIYKLIIMDLLNRHDNQTINEIVEVEQIN